MVSKTSVIGRIERRESGKGRKKEAWRARVEKYRYDMEIEVEEKRYQQKEYKKAMAEVIKRLDVEILGDNKGLHQVESDLHLVRRIPGFPIEVEWRVQENPFLDGQGKLDGRGLPKEGKTVEIQGILIYEKDRKKKQVFQRNVQIYPPISNEKKRIGQALEWEIQKKEEETRKDFQVTLPKTVDGKKVWYYRPFHRRGVGLMGMSILLMILFWGLERQGNKEKEEERRKVFLREYPNIVSKLAIYLSSGMTLKYGWKLIAFQGGEGQGKEEVYQEMKKAIWEMESGVSEVKSYQNFGERCGIREYLRLSTLLIQNMRKGTKDLTRLLQMEGRQAFEDRKIRAKKEGEKASLRLLMPMFLILITVLLMVIVPAFLSLQM